MALLQRIETRFGLTRGDVTLTLFLSFTALVGFVYMTFFESDERLRNRTELAELVAYSDSIDRTRRAAIEDRLALHPDSVQRVEPLTPDELLGDQEGPRGRDLTLEEVAPIDINTASLGILDLLPGVGEKTAHLIAAERPFRSVDEVTRVRGIGPKTFAKMKSWIVATAVSASGSGSDSAPGLDGEGALPDSADTTKNDEQDLQSDPEHNDTSRDVADTARNARRFDGN